MATWLRRAITRSGSSWIERSDRRQLSVTAEEVIEALRRTKPDDEKSQANVQAQAGEPRLFKIRRKYPRQKRESEEALLLWRLRAGAILERYPILTPSLANWEIEYMLWKVKQTEHGIDLNEALGLYDKRDKLEEDEMPQVLSEAQTNVFKFGDIKVSGGRSYGPKVEADRRNVNRMPAEKLFLVALNALTDRWEFPSVQHKASETLRATAERASAEHLGWTYYDSTKGQPDSSTLDIYYMSNAPAGYLQHDADGVRTFLYRSQYLGGPIHLHKDAYKDYNWVCADEFKDYFAEKEADYLHDVLNSSLAASD